MNKYLLVLLFMFSTSSFAIPSVVNCTTGIVSSLSKPITLMIKNICSNKLLGYNAFFIFNATNVSEDIIKKITVVNFYIIDPILNQASFAFDKVTQMLYLNSDPKNKAPLVFGSELTPAPNVTWLNKVLDNNPLVQTDISYINYFFDGLDYNHHHDTSHEKAYKYALIGSCAVIVILVGGVAGYIIKTKRIKDQEHLPLVEEYREEA